MRFARIAALLSLVFITSLAALAQTTTPASSPSPEDQEKLNKLNAAIQQGLDEMSAGLMSLHLPENRAVVDAMVGDMYWQYDQKRSRDLFRSAGSELAAYNADIEKQTAAAASDTTRRGPGGLAFLDITFGGDPRYQVIPLIAKHDATLAMQIMLQTRRQEIANAMADNSQNNGGRRGRAAGPNGNGFGGVGSFGFGANAQAGQELALQQQIAYLAADQDPDLAVKLIKDSMSTGISAGVLPLLQKLAKLDDKKAADLGADIVQKIVDADMTASQDPMRAGINFLQYSTKLQTAGTDASTKQFNFTDAQQHDIANKLISALLAMPTTQASNNWFNQVIPLVDKVAPDRSMALKQRQAEIQSTASNTNGRGSQQRQAMQNLFGPTTTADQILAQLPGMPDNEKGMAYAALGSKIGSMTDDAAAQKIIDSVSDENARSTLQQQFDSASASRAIQAGKLDDARKQIAAITDKHQQLQRYVALAIAYNQSGTENDVKTAKSILRDARALTSPYPDTGDDLSDLMEVVRGYAVIEPDTAFRMAEPGIDLLTQYVQATAVLSKFNRDRTFRNGELIFRTNNGFGGSQIFRYLPQMQLLGKADLERANRLLDRFSRPDARMILKLYVLQGALPAPPSQPATATR